MKEKLSAIVLGTIKHSDKHNVTNIYTRERGRMAILSPAGASSRSRQSAARLQPLSVVEMQLNVSATRDLHIPSAIAPLKVWRSIYYDPVKAVVTMFISEFLGRLLRDAPPEPMLWDFIESSTAYFDSISDRNSIANYHLAFLVGMCRLTGIFPDAANYTDGMEFDMQAGKMMLPFSPAAKKGFRIDARKSAVIPTLLRINYANSACFRFNGHERSEILEGILKYFGCHFPGCDNLKSPGILREIFS